MQEIIVNNIKTLFLDIGGVLLTDGWGHESRFLAAEKFGLNTIDMEERHAFAFDNYELGKITLDDYLDTVVFYQHRGFSKDDFIDFMFEQSKALDGNIQFFKEIKHRHQLKVIAVSNEGRDLNEYRIEKFKLDELFDAYISSCYVHLRKPCKDILQMACDISHTLPGNALYIDDMSVLIDEGNFFGLQTLHFQGLEVARLFIETCTFYKH